MRIRPILFNTPMVQAVRKDLKTATRRLLPADKVLGILMSPSRIKMRDVPDASFINVLCDQEYEKGDVLWVREAWCQIPVSPGGHTRIPGVYYYKADGEMRPEGWRNPWRPSIHMPKEAAREFLLVTNVWAERLHEMTDEDYIKEGIRLTERENVCKCDWEEPRCREKPCRNRDAFEAGKLMWKFAQLWDSTIPEEKMSIYGYAANPWVCAIEFERCEKPKEF